MRRTTGRIPKWHHKKAQLYQLRMKRRPTRAERRFDDYLDEALKGFNEFPTYKPTQAKKTKWDRKKRQFKKQKIFEDHRHRKAYIVDFYIPLLKLAIEIDGPSHKLQIEYDQVRTSFLATRGIKVIRLLNKETESNVKKQCIIRIVQEVRDRIKELEAKYDNHHSRKIIQTETVDVDKLTEQYIKNGGQIKKCPIKNA